VDISGEGGTQGVRGFFGSVAGRVGQFLNLTSWYVMKDRSGKVGENGVAPCVRELRKEHPKLRIHLVGHSLGGRLMAACANALAKPPEVKVDSLTLLQAAFSHYGLSADNLHGSPGFFRDVIAKKVVTGPMVATFSFQDTVVGKAYAISSRLAGDNTKAVGDENDQYGGIGRNGAQNLKEFASERLRDVGSAYTLKPDVVQCLDGSGGLITSHGDVRNERVTWAFASAVAATK
jgi:pimeloyl-ACP methyl ester carboxylesterase